jgi:hypothetical protein
MSIDVNATYRDGAIYPDTPLNLPENTPVHVRVVPQTPAAPPPEEGPARLTPPPSPRFTAEQLDALIEKHSVSVGSLPENFSRADIYSDHD